MKRFLQVAGLLLLLGAALWALTRLGLIPSTHVRPLEHRELATRGLAENLAQRFPGKKAIVLSNPFSQEPGQPKHVYAFEKSGIRGIEKGLAGRLMLEAIVFPELKPGALENPHRLIANPDTTTPLSYLISDGALDKAAAEHPDAEVIISLIGLPVNVASTRAWAARPPHKFALLLPDLRVLGGESAIVQGFSNGQIAAIVINKPGAPPESQPMGKDIKMEFDQRFLLVTPENLENCRQAYPRLFAP